MRSVSQHATLAWVTSLLSGSSRPVLFSVLLAGLGVLLLGSGCSSTKLNSYRNPKALASRPFIQILVVAVDDRHEVRKIFEDEFAFRLKQHQVEASVTYTNIPLSLFQKDRETIQKALAPWKAEAVLITSLDDRTSVASAPQIRGSLWEPSLIWYGAEPSSMGFYSASGDLRTIVRLKSSLYRVSDGALVWVGYTDTVLKESTDTVLRMRAVVEKIVSQLAKDDLVP